MTLPVALAKFRPRLSKGARAEQRVAGFIRHARHDPEPLGLAGTDRMDFSTNEADRERHRQADFRCRRCGLFFEVRSARVGMTMAKSRYPFWQGKPLDTTYVIHVNMRNRTFEVVKMRDLARTRLKAQVRIDAERGYPYYWWPPKLLAPLLCALPRCEPKSKEKPPAQPEAKQLRIGGM